MAYRVTMPNGDTLTNYAIHIVKWYEGKGVVCLDARGKPVGWVPVTDVEKGRRVRDMINGALNGERRYRTLDWSFLNQPLPPETPEPQPKAAKTEPGHPASSQPQPKTTKLE